MLPPPDRKEIYIKSLPEYEMKLLTALSFFLGREVSTQAAACLAMYVRQSHDRILNQVDYYAHRTGMHRWDLLDLIADNPQKAEELMRGTGDRIHTSQPDVFDEPLA